MVAVTTVYMLLYAGECALPLCSMLITVEPKLVVDTLLYVSQIYSFSRSVVTLFIVSRENGWS